MAAAAAAAAWDAWLKSSLEERLHVADSEIYLEYVEGLMSDDADEASRVAGVLEVLESVAEPAGLAAFLAELPGRWRAKTDEAAAAAAATRDAAVAASTAAVRSAAQAPRVVTRLSNTQFDEEDEEERALRKRLTLMQTYDDGPDDGPDDDLQDAQWTSDRKAAAADAGGSLDLRSVSSQLGGGGAGASSGPGAKPAAGSGSKADPGRKPDGTPPPLRGPEVISVFRLTQLRAKSSSKTLTAWAEQLALTGRLLTQGRHIVVLLEGSSAAVKEFALRVKSLEEGSKEKLLEAAGEQRVPGTSRRFGKFEHQELKAEPDLRGILVQANLSTAIVDAALKG